ncbi:MAG: TlpA disulfide reductase family protein [Bacteroidota bacterium]
MKRLLNLVIFFNILWFSGFAQKPDGKFVLNGKVAGRDTGIMVLSYTADGNRDVSDTIRLKNGTFSFTGTIAEPTVAELYGLLRLPKSYNMYDPDFVTIFLEPAKMQITLNEHDYAHARMTGSFTQHQNEILQRQLAPLLKIYIPLVNEYGDLADLYRTKKDTSAAINGRLDYILEKTAPLKEKVQKTYLAFLTAHPDSYVSADIIYSWILLARLGADSTLMYYNRASKRIQNSQAGRAAYKRISQYVKARRAVEKSGAAAIGSLAPDFAVTDENGASTTLSSYKQKNCVLIDFWAGWCVPCCNSVPALQQVYKLYRQKGLQVVMVSLDQNLAAFQIARKKYHLTGLPYAFNGGINAPGNLAKETYGVLGIPNLVLIDKTGKIIGRYEEPGDTALSRQLDVLLQ